MAAPTSTRGARELRHTVPQFLLALRNQTDAHEEFDGEGIQLWLNYELEALRYGVDTSISYEDLKSLVVCSTVVSTLK